MRRRLLTERKTSAARRARLVFVLALGAPLAGCGGSEEEEDLSVPPSPEEAGEVVVRVSGTEGVAYSGTYGTIEGMLQTVEDTVGAEPTHYPVEVAQGVSDGVTAGFQKIETGEGELQIEILADEEVIVESRTLADSGAVNADWFPQASIPEVLPGESEEAVPGEEELAPEENPPPEEKS